METVEVVIVGAGPAGLATSACLNRLNISHVLLEREDSYASLWKNRSYDRLKLHLAEQFCELPHMPFPKDAPNYVPKKQFIQYLDTYVSTFKISPLYHRNVETAFYDEDVEKWSVLVTNRELGVQERYYGKFLVVETGENSEGYIPHTNGLEIFKCKVLHSNEYGNSEKYCGKNVLVVGSGNFGMTIVYDLSNYGANASVVVRSPIVDGIARFLSWWNFGNLSEYGIQVPTTGPFHLKEAKGQAPSSTLGLSVLPSITSIEGNEIRFENGCLKSYDAIVFATGYKTNVLKWLKDGNHLFGDDGMPKNTFPNHWKSKNGLYCVGFARRELFGISHDAHNITNDIKFLSRQRTRKGSDISFQRALF